jgi:hypothetical protein
VKKILVLAAILSIICFSYGTSQAATSVLDNLPGGAAVGYWDCTGGTQTLISVSNVTSQLCGDTAVLVHFTFYSADSVKRADFTVPLSARDTWSAALTCSGGTVTITPALPQGGFLAAGDTGELTRVFGDTGTNGYYTTVVSRVDDTQFGGAGICGIIYGGNGDGDPRNDFNWSNFDIVMPNVLYLRNAYVNLTALNAWALNGWMLQDFFNVGTLSENVFGEFMDSIFDFWCPANTVDWNQDGNLAQAHPGTDDGAGLNIDPWELYIHDSLFGSIVADFCNVVGRQRAFGAGYDASFVNPASGIYWARYNVDPGAGTNSSLIAVMPAATAMLANDCQGGANNMNFLSYDDEEIPQTWTLCPREANPLTIGQGAGYDIAVNHPYGEMRIAANIPMMGYILTTGPNYADIYPLIRENAAIYPQNFTFYPYIFGLSEIYYIGN